MQSFYPLILAVHNILRWAVIIFALLALVRAYMGWFGARPWKKMDRMAGVFFASAMDLQLLIGLLLYFVLSPITRAAFSDFGAAMGNAELRFFVMEHFFYMVLATILVHVGSVVARRASLDVQKHRRAAIFYTLALVFILIAIPWDRSLLPGL